MGLIISTLLDFPYSKRRKYYIYFLEYELDDPFREVFVRNFHNLASFAAENDSLVIRGTRFDFYDEVLSWHSINGVNANEILPAILITNRSPRDFSRRQELSDLADIYDNYKKEFEKDNETFKLILIPLRKVCESPDKVISLIQCIMEDIKNKKNLEKFQIQKILKKGIGKAIVDAIILEPNISGIGFSFKKLIKYLKGKKTNL